MADELPVRFSSQESANAFIHGLVQSETQDNPPKATYKSFIKTLKVIKPTEGILKALMATSCPICTDEFQLDHKLVKLPCSHWYHCDCLLKWLSRNNTCSMCRSEFPTEPVKKYEHVGRLADGSGFSIIVYGSSRLISVTVREDNDSHYVTIKLL